MIELLANQMTDHGILSALMQLPIGLTATYHRILTKIDELPSRTWCLRALTWLLCAKRPLELSELMTGIAINDMDISVGWDVTRVPNNPSDVIFDCKGLISCTPTPHARSHGIMVQFAHTSVRDFLLTNPVNVVSTVPTYHIFPRSKGHALLAKWCLAYLALECRTKLGAHQEREKSDAPHLNLYTYVKSYWNTHIQESKNPELLATFEQVISDPDVLQSFGGGSPLHVALKYNLAFIVEHLLTTKAKLTVLDAQSNSALHLSVINPKWVQILLARNLDIHAKNIHGMTPLHMATNLPLLPGQKAGPLTNLANSVAMLIDSGADIELKDARGCTPLHLAAASGQLESMIFLITKQACITTVDAKGLTPLHYAAEKGEVGAIQILLASGADMNSRDHHLLTPIHVVSRHGYVEAMQIMIQKGADLEVSCLDGMTPLHYAVIHGSFEAVKLLLNQGVNVNCSDSDLSTPLHYAAAEGNIEIVKSLISHGAWFDAVDDEDMLPMHHAAEYGHYQVIKTLLDSGDNINCKTQLNLTPLYYAAEHEQQETVMFLIEHGADTTAVVTDELTPLHHAVQKGEQETIILLIQHGANINVATINQWTSLHFASANGQLETIKTLCQLGADINSLTENHSTALHLAAWHGHLDICRYLMGKMSTTEDFANEYQPIHLAAWRGHVEVMELLLAHGTDMNLKTAPGWTPLHLAAWTGSTEIVKFLVDNKAQVEAVSEDDHLTAQHLAAWKGNVAALQCLLQGGADINRCCKSGVTPLRLAIHNHQLVAAGFLLDAIGGDIDIGIDIVDAHAPNRGYRFPTTPSI